MTALAKENLKYMTLGLVDLNERDEDKAKKKAARNLKNQELSAQAAAQDDIKNASRTSANAKKKIPGGSSILTSPMGASTTAATAVTKLGG